MARLMLLLRPEVGKCLSSAVKGCFQKEGSEPNLKARKKVGILVSDTVTQTYTLPEWWKCVRIIRSIG